jgi:hypothetical protein
MRLVSVVSLAVAVVAMPIGGAARAQLTEPFVAVGVWYPEGPSNPATLGSKAVGASRSDADRWRRDLAAIKAAGFNSIRTGIDWASVEPERGQYRLERFGELLSAADTAGLRVIVQVDTVAAPAWLHRRYQDSAVVPEPGARAAMQARGASQAHDYCMDHPGVRADLGAFIGAAASAASGHSAVYAIDVWRNPGVSSHGAQFCYCPYTQARFRDALQRKYRSLDALNAAWTRSFRAWAGIQAPLDPLRSAPDVVDWKQFTAAKLQEDLKFRADASAPRGARAVTAHADAVSRSRVDDWLMTTVVDHYGSSIPSLSGTDPIALMASLDTMRSAARDKPWWVGALQAGAGARSTSPPTGADLRLRAWAAISRGAGTISIDNWRVLSGDEPAGPSPTGRLRTAGDVAGIIGRNSSLFWPLRPHASKVAIVAYAGSPAGGPGTNSSGSPFDVYKAFFDRNVQVDFVHPDEVVAGFASRYDLIYAGDIGASSGSVAEMLKAFVRAGGTLIAETSSGSSRLPAAIGGAQGLADIFVAAPSPRGPRAGEQDVVAGTYGAGRTFLIHRRPAARGREGGGVRGIPPQRAQNARRGLRPASPLQRAIAAAGVKPEVGIDATGQLVEARFLESSDAMLLVAMNHGSTPHKVTFTFGPDVPEAIWQNMESGAAVNFVQGAEGPTYTRTMAARDVMVLVRGKRLR